MARGDALQSSKKLEHQVGDGPSGASGTIVVGLWARLGPTQVAVAPAIGVETFWPQLGQTSFVALGLATVGLVFQQCLEHCGVVANGGGVVGHDCEHQLARYGHPEPL